MGMARSQSMSSSFSENEKDRKSFESQQNVDAQPKQPHLNEDEQEKVEAAQPPFTVREDIEDSAAAPDDKQSPISLQNVPNGGFRAWLQVMGSFFLWFNAWGIINAFGVYQDFYVKGTLFHEAPSNISWIGSVQGFLLLVISSLAGPIYDAGHARALILTGSFLIVFGQMMLSLCTTYWQVFLAQAICIGFGTGCIFVTSVAILSTYFSTRIATATGIAATGSSIGGMIYPIMFAKLQPLIGFAWASRALGLVAFTTLVIANLATTIRTTPSSRRQFFDVTAWKHTPYVLFTLGLFLNYTGLYAVMFYIEAYGTQSGIMNPKLGLYLLTILNAASTFGRAVPNFFADRIGSMNMLLPCITLSSVVCFSLIAARNSATLIVCTIFFGFFAGSIVSLPPSIFVHMSKDKRHLIGTRMGMAFAVGAFGVVIGPPVAGAILASSGFTNVWIFAGVFTMLSSVFVVAARVLQAGWSPYVKV